MSALAAYLTARRVQHMDRPAFDRWQQRRLSCWLTRDLPQVAFYRDADPHLHSLPVIDKTTVMADFEAFNTAGITATEGWHAMATTGRICNISVGASTGTSGNRALYAITRRERYRWLGAILAKALPDFYRRRERVAIILPQSSELYHGANRAGLMRLRFFDLRDGPEVWTPTLDAFTPTTIVAPPRVLRHLAEHAPAVAPRKLFSGGETLDPIDRTMIEAHFGLTLGQIYMATEGLLGVTCPHGRLHLAEDATHFELEPVGDGLVSPLITGFRRQFQIMARYRMNDLLRLSRAPCPCGSPLRAVDEVVGRMDDAFAFGPVLITPDILRNAVLDAARGITDFRILRDGPRDVQLRLPGTLPPPQAGAAQTALQSVFDRRGLTVTVTLTQSLLSHDQTRKLRRVENRWSPKT